MSEPFRIQFVCTGNSCRSPVAAALLRKRLQEEGLDQNVEVGSCGVSAIDGAEASSGALKMAEKRGLNLEGFASTKINQELVEKTDLFLVLERFHRDYIDEVFPQAADRVRQLGFYLYPDVRDDIPDPVGGDESLYDGVTQLMETAVNNLINDWQSLRMRFYESRQLFVALGADHRGFEEKERTGAFLNQLGYACVDCGTSSTESCDHPDYAIQVAQLVALGRVDRGILICGSGHGMIITANKLLGVRAILPVNAEHATVSRQHNNANVLALGAGFMSSEAMQSMIKAWLETPFLGGKYQNRLNKITDFERARMLSPM
mgnify:CR=1 FL=1